MQARRSAWVALALSLLLLAVAAPLAPVRARQQTPAPAASLSITRATVNTTVHYSLVNFPAGSTVTAAFIRGDRGQIALGSVTSTSWGGASGSFRVPAVPKGTNHFVRFVSGGSIVDVRFEVRPRIKLVPDSGARGDTVNVSLRGMEKRASVLIRWRIDGVWTQITRVTTSNTGSANVDITVPSNAAPGSNSVRADSPGSAAQTNAFEVVGGASGSLLPPSGPVDSTIHFELAGCEPGDEVTITLESSTGAPITLGTTTIDALGESSGSFKVPAAPAGAYRIVFRSELGGCDPSLPFEIKPRILILPSAAPHGAPVNVSLRGYGPREVVKIRWKIGDSFFEAATVTTSSTGSANVTVNVPGGTPIGPNVVRGDGVTYRAQTSAFSVLAPVVSLSTFRGPVGSTLTFTVTNLAPNSEIVAFWTTNTGLNLDIGRVIADASGVATATILVPAIPGGTGHRLEIVNFWTDTAYANFTVEATFTAINPNTNTASFSIHEEMSVELSGFGDSEMVSLQWWNGTDWEQFGSIMTNWDGTAAGSLPVPQVIGTIEIRAHGANNILSTVVTIYHFAGGASVDDAAVDPAPEATATTPPTDDAEPPSPAPVETPAETPVETPVEEPTAEPAPDGDSDTPATEPEPDATESASEP